MSPNANCTNMTRVYNDPNPSYQNMVNGPSFGQVNVNNGTYQCVAWKMSDILQYRPIANDGNDCVANTLYTRDLFRTNVPAETSTCPDGTVITGTGTMLSQVEDKMCIYLSVNGNNSANGMIATDPMALSNPFVVSSDTQGTMVTDFTNKISDVGSECDCDAPVFRFR
ncbi:MAG: hypothetical protein ACKVQC_07225 [Elusimicrobiota bacterium]